MRNLIGIVALSLLAAVAGCASDDGEAKKTTLATSSDPNDPFAGIEQGLDRFSGTCTMAGSLLTVTLPNAANTTVISKRIVDSMLTVNGEDCGLASVIKQIVVNENGAGGLADTLIVDYTNGLFAVGAAATSTAISINLGTGTNVVGIKGTSVADNVTLGKATAAEADLSWKYWAKMNSDAYPDVYIIKPNGGTLPSLKVLGEAAT